MATKRYMSYDNLVEYDENIKLYVDGEVDKLSSEKANISHTHDDRYYTETEVDKLITNVNTSITNITNGSVVVKEAEHATNADTADEATHATTADSATTANSANTATSATKATQDGNGKVISSTYETKTDASAKLEEAKTYTDTVASGKSDKTHNHDSAYDAKGSASDALASAKSYADGIKNDLLNGAGTAYDTLKELGDLIDDNADAIEALETIASGKADASHGHAISDVSGLQSALDSKAAASHGTHVSYSTTAPVMDGTASVGTASTVARSDHKHPTDTSRASKTEFDTHVADTTKHITSTERTNWGTAYTHSQSAHAPSNAQANVIESIKVNGTTQTISSKSVNITVPTKASDIGAAATSHTHAISDVTNLQTTLNNASSAITANTSSISAHTDRITILENKIGDGFEEITSADIKALFA